MKVWPVLGTLLSLVTGGVPDAPANVEPSDDAEYEEPAPRETGFGIEGDGFYVWDEDRREVEDWAIELAGPAFPHAREDF